MDYITAISAEDGNFSSSEKSWNIYQFSSTSANIDEDVDFTTSANNATPSFDNDSENTELLLETISWSSWLLIVLFSTLIVITMVGNVLVCLSVILVRKLRKPQNYLLVSLAISDLFVAIFVMPFAVALEAYGGTWPFNDLLCDLWVSADVLCCTASILNLCGISVDRFRAITTPLEYSSKTTPRRMLLVIFIVWLGSACVSLPPVLLLGNVHQDSHGKQFCSVSQNFWYQIYATMAAFYLPVTVMGFIYVRILLVVADQKKKMDWKPPHLHVRQSTRRASSTNSLPVAANSPPRLSESPLLASEITEDRRPSHTLVTRALVTSSVGGSPVTVTSVVSSATSSPHRKGSVSASTKANKNNNIHQKQQKSNSINQLLVSSNGRGSNVHAMPVPTPPSRHSSQQNGANGSAAATTYFFGSPTKIPRLKKEKIFGGLKEHKASTTLGIIMSAFVICWLPFFVVALLRPFLSLHDIEIPEWMGTLFNWLGWANSALNPVIYATLNRDFRKPFREILYFRCATLDDIMRRDFYHQHYGDDLENFRRRRFSSRPHIENDPDGPTSL